MQEKEYKKKADKLWGWGGGGGVVLESMQIQVSTMQCCGSESGIRDMLLF